MEEWERAQGRGWKEPQSLWLWCCVLRRGEKDLLQEPPPPSPLWLRLGIGIGIGIAIWELLGSRGRRCRREAVTTGLPHGEAECVQRPLILPLGAPSPLLLYIFN